MQTESDTFGCTWLTSGEIAKLLDISRNTMARWSSKGLVRTKDSGVKRKNSPWMLYCFEDCQARTGKRKKPAPFLNKLVDGVRIFRCNHCLEWKERGCFYEDRTKRRSHGILSYCKVCHCEMRNARLTDEVKAQRQAEKVRLGRERTRMARAASAWSPTEVSAQSALDVVVALRPDMKWEHISEEAGVHKDTVRRIASQAKKGSMVKIQTIDRLLVGLGEPDAMRSLYDEIDAGRPRWHEKHDYCQRCLRTSVAYMAAGMCSTCYRQRNNPDYKTRLEAQWSTTRTCCKVCLTSERPHRAKGMCNACYLRWYKEINPRRVGSGHGDVQPKAHGQVVDHRSSGIGGQGR